MGFALFLFLNFLLFVRPEELYPHAIGGYRLYYFTFIGCLIFSLKELSANLSLSKLLGEPISCCIFLYGCVFTISNFVTADLYTARTQGVAFLKLFLYYFVLTSLLNSEVRLRTFLGAMVFLIGVVSLILFLDHFEILPNDEIEPYMQNEYDDDGSIIDVFPRLRYLGYFQDPNDLSMILGVGIIAAAYRFWTGLSILRVFWLIPIGAFAYLMTLTQSRGGFLGLLAGIALYLASRLGWKRTTFLGAVGIAGLLIFAGGRQSNFSLDSGTGQDRLRLWSDGLTIMTQPRTFLFGIGFGKYEEETGHVAHNSYVHAFVETGFLGGILFSGMCVLGLGLVFRQRSERFTYYSPTLAALQPFLLAMLADYLMCMFSLTRNYVEPTYLMLGLMTTFLRLSYNQEELSWYKMDLRMTILISGLGLLVYVALKVFLMMFVQFGVR
jgi:putative inorganic carbon (HCO3(-)) transporter